MMIALLFLIFVAVTTAVLVALSARFLGSRTALRWLGGLLIWFAYVGVLGYFGVVKNMTLRPPGITFIFVPVVAFLIIFIARPATSARIARALPIWILLLTQVFRVVVELFLHQLWIVGLVPRMLTFSGANVDIYIGATAPLIAWISTCGKSGRKVAMLWNVLGLLALANVVTRAVLTTPGPLNMIHTEIPNQLIGTFPYMFVPAFFVPLAIVLHVLAMQAIKRRQRTGKSGATETDRAGA